ncbi:N-acetylglucosaminyl transferase component-domain-containing protein [Infundibulicybe gibba]|nr:N-acetylglucosaminyl transferase component-domain-containing protein [Infundibulicybe gibba]
MDVMALQYGGSSDYAVATQHDFTLRRNMLNTTGIDVATLNQFNTASPLDELILRYPKPPGVGFSWPHIFVLSAFFKIVTIFSGLLTQVCNIQLSSIPLKDISATIQQIDVRAEQAIFFITEIISLRQRASTPMALYSTKYTNFFNTLWLILNDITIGVAFGASLRANHITLAHLLNRAVEDAPIKWVQWALGWLDSWPAGLKLNTELSRFYSHTFIDLIEIWAQFLRSGTPYTPAVIYAIGIISCGGMTMTISLLMDLLSLFSFHIYLCYSLSNAVYQKMLRTTGSLWNLFRGKRYNVLRNRTDSWEYDIDQLLFGTILFTLVAFLFPTVLAYYALFALLRLSTLLLQAGMDILLAFMNHFPLFALMLRVKSPWRLPGGIYFEVVTSTSRSGHNQPVPLSAIFFQYRHLWAQLSSHYNPLRLLKCVFAGDYLTAISRHSIRYSKVPRNVVMS